MYEIRVAQNSNIEIDSIPTEPAKKPPEEFQNFLAQLEHKKVSGGIFQDQSIKLIREEQRNGFHYNMAGNGINSISKSVAFTDAKSYNKDRGNNNGGDGGMSDLERRVENLEYQNRQIQEQLNDVKQQTFLINSKLDNCVTKVDLLQLENSIKTSIQEAVKLLPTESTVKTIVDDSITNKNLTTETKVENIILKSQKGVIKWVVGTGIACAGLIATCIKLFM
ncbi:hypothetical protein ABEP17_03540 [Priestia flexa]|uniref:hypothetical protein n=1 Tax=Priestia flexa TaxID=86664 RepID=UPI003D2B3045